MHIDGTLRFENSQCILNNNELEMMILEEAHGATYAVHSSNTNTYKDLKKTYWWNNMNHEIADFVSRYLAC